MNPGYKKAKIIIQKCSTKSDKIGNRKEIWTDFKKCYAYVNNLSGTEYWAAAQTNNEDIVEFLISWHSYISDLDTKQYRVVCNNLIYDIKSIDNIQYKNKDVKIRTKTKKELAI